MNKSEKALKLLSEYYNGVDSKMRFHFIGPLKKAGNFLF